MNATGTVVARYTYNAWGAPLSVTTDNGTAITNPLNIAHLNPLRYRGYYYDSETGFYYLQSRYYDPENCRFINADSYTTTNTGIIGYNMYTYCLNNPIVCADYDGYRVVYVIYYRRDDGEDDFSQQAYNSPYYNTSEDEVHYICVTYVEDFVAAWNSIKDADNVYIFIHGGEGFLSFLDNGYLGADEEHTYDELNDINVSGKIYLMSCSGGNDTNENSVAYALAKKANTTVRACTGGVSYSKVNGKYYARKYLRDLGIWKDYFYSASNTKKSRLNWPGRIEK